MNPEDGINLKVKHTDHVSSLSKVLEEQQGTHLKRNRPRIAAEATAAVQSMPGMKMC